MELGAGGKTESEADPEASTSKIVEDAERTAASVSELADSLIEYASNATREADRLVAQLREAVGAAEESTASGTGDPIDTDDAPSLSMGARVLISQLVVGGASRDEIGKRLRDDFGIDDTAGMLDAVLSPAERD